MIKVEIYKNGVIIEGHSSQEICTLVSATTFYLYESIFDKEIDIDYYTRAEHSVNKLEGISIMKFDNSLDIAKDYFNNYKKNIKGWCGFNFPNQVKIIDIDDNVKFPKKYLDRLQEWYKE